MIFGNMLLVVTMNCFLSMALFLDFNRIYYTYHVPNPATGYNSSYPLYSNGCDIPVFSQSTFS